MENLYVGFIGTEKQVYRREQFTLPADIMIMVNGYVNVLTQGYYPFAIFHVKLQFSYVFLSQISKVKT